jgi:hypothetical protein
MEQLYVFFPDVLLYRLDAAKPVPAKHRQFWPDHPPSHHLCLHAQVNDIMISVGKQYLFERFPGLRPVFKQIFAPTEKLAPTQLC